MTQRLTFTIYHGLLASLAIHAALTAPFVLPLPAPAPDEPEPLVIEFKGVAAANQSEEKVVQETKDEETKDKIETAKPEDPASAQPPQPDEKQVPVDKEPERPAPPEQAVPSVAAPRPEEAKSGNAGANDVIGATERQEAQTIRTDPITEADILRNYLRLLSKKVKANLVYPETARDARLQGLSVVSFTMLPDGQIRPETLKIARSSGKPKLDAAALKTVAASAPFDRPPREMTVSIDVEFKEMGKK